MSNSDLPSSGPLFIWFSCWPQSPPPDDYSEISDEGVYQEDVFEWLAEHVFCDGGSPFFNSDSIHLMDPLVYENVCEEFPVTREIDFAMDTVVWNMPKAQVEETTLRGVGYDPFNYTIWNVSFPVYQWGDPETQRKVQRSFELKLRNNYIPQNSLDGCRVAVVGKESEFWLVTRISQEEKDLIQLIGIIFLGLQTIALLLVPLVGKKLAQRDARRREELVLDIGKNDTHSEGSMDEMLRTSKGCIDMPQMNDVEKAEPVGDVELPVPRFKNSPKTWENTRNTDMLKTHSKEPSEELMRPSNSHPDRDGPQLNKVEKRPPLGGAEPAVYARSYSTPRDWGGERGSVRKLAKLFE